MARRLVIPLALAGAVLVAAATAPAHREKPHANCARTSTGYVPLTDLGTRTYEGFRGGLYPNGRNAPSKRYLAQGLAAARRVHPIDGKVVLLSIGMSNTTQEWSTFMQLQSSFVARAPELVVVDGAQGGQDAEIVKDPSARYWQVVAQRLRQAGATSAQVQAVWLKEAIARPAERFPADAMRLRDDLRAIVVQLAQRFPNLQLIYVSSRTYGGYASTQLNPEPFAYQSGFAVKWLVGERIDGKLKIRPWVGWGPYLWTDGEKGRADRFVWMCSDTRDDGTHPSESGRQKVAQQLLRFFATDPTAQSWFRG